MPKKPTKKRKSSAIAKADYEQLAAFRNALREFLHFSEQAAIAAGVRPQQHQALLVICGTPGRDSITVGELAAQLKIRHHSAVGLVNRMEAEGLITKSHGPLDRRQVLIRITPRGMRTLEKLSAAHKAELVRIGPVIRKIFKRLKTVH